MRSLRASCLRLQSQPCTIDYVSAAVSHSLQMSLAWLHHEWILCDTSLNDLISCSVRTLISFVRGYSVAMWYDYLMLCMLIGNTSRNTQVLWRSTVLQADRHETLANRQPMICLYISAQHYVFYHGLWLLVSEHVLTSRYIMYLLYQSLVPSRVPMHCFTFSLLSDWPIDISYCHLRSNPSSLDTSIRMFPTSHCRSSLPSATLQVFPLRQLSIPFLSASELSLRKSVFNSIISLLSSIT